jgi:mRNA-degrading endonuclease toxin of MazEF toxin-antitoxin module
MRQTPRRRTTRIVPSTRPRAGSLSEADLERGDLFFGRIEVEEGRMLEKRWLVVSTDAINHAGIHPIVARVTDKARERNVPTAVEVEPDAENNLPEVSYVLCHDLLTLIEDAIGDRFGRLGAVDQARVDIALRYALSLDGAGGADPGADPEESIPF